MKALAWYTVIVNGLLIIAFILTALKVIPPPPITVREDIAWAILMVPTVVLGILVLRRSG